MARKQESRRMAFDRLRGAASALKRMFTRRGNAAEIDDSARSISTSESPRGGRHRAADGSARTTRREADIGLDVIGRAYTPSATSSKASFRSDGADHQRDQEFALGVADDRWNDEDRITNKSGDPRIGTHRRTYEPAEARTESRE